MVSPETFWHYMWMISTTTLLLIPAAIWAKERIMSKENHDKDKRRQEAGLIYSDLVWEKQGNIRVLKELLRDAWEKTDDHEVKGKLREALRLVEANEAINYRLLGFKGRDT